MCDNAEPYRLRRAPPQPLRIVSLWRRTPAQPGQWEGWDERGCAVVIHYRARHLVVRWGHDAADAAAREPIVVTMCRAGGRARP